MTFGESNNEAHSNYALTSLRREQSFLKETLNQDIGEKINYRHDLTGDDLNLVYNDASAKTCTRKGRLYASQVRETGPN